MIRLDLKESARVDGVTDQELVVAVREIAERAGKRCVMAECGGFPNPLTPHENAWQRAVNYVGVSDLVAIVLLLLSTVSLLTVDQPYVALVSVLTAMAVIAWLVEPFLTRLVHRIYRRVSFPR